MFLNKQQRIFEQTVLAVIGPQNVCVPFGSTIMFGLPNGYVLDHDKTLQLTIFLSQVGFTHSQPRGRADQPSLGPCDLKLLFLFFWQLLFLNKQFVKRDWLKHGCTLLAWFGQRCFFLS